jgi:hypothetical protein
VDGAVGPQDAVLRQAIVDPRTSGGGTPVNRLTASASGVPTESGASMIMAARSSSSSHPGMRAMLRMICFNSAREIRGFRPLFYTHVLI